MPANRNALIRYKTIDNCLRRRNRRWTLEDLIEACSDALYEYEGIDKGISKGLSADGLKMYVYKKNGVLPIAFAVIVGIAEWFLFNLTA